MQHLPLVGAAERLDEGRHGRQIAGVDGPLGLDHPRCEALAEGRHVLPACGGGQRQPRDGENERQCADVRGRQQLDGHQDENRGRSLTEALHEDVDEGLGLDPQLLGDRKEEELPRRLIDGVAKRALAEKEQPDQRVDRARAGSHRRDHRQLGDRHRTGQHPQADTDAEHAVNAAGDAELEEEPDQPHGDEGQTDHRGPLVEQARVLLHVPVELPLHELADDDRRQHEEPDQGQQPRAPERPQTAAGIVVTARGRPGRGGRGPAPVPFDQQDQDRYHHHDRRRAEQGVAGPQDPGQLDSQKAPEDRAEESARPDEREQPAGLPGVEDLIGIGPELRNRDGKCHSEPHVVDDRHPAPAEGEQPEENHQRRDVQQGAADNQRLEADPVRQPRVQNQHRKRDHGHDEVDPRQVLGAEKIDEGRLAHALGGEVDGREKQELGEEEPGDHGLAAVDAEGGFAHAAATRRGPMPAVIGWLRRRLPALDGRSGFHEPARYSVARPGATPPRFVTADAGAFDRTGGRMSNERS